MGIDIYMKWDGQTKEEEKKQFQGFDCTIGDAGYLREAYHGEPYATKILVPEAFESDGEIEISADKLKKRLPKVLETARKRSLKIYNKETSEEDPEIKAFSDFVSLAEAKEKELGKPVRIYASY